MYNTFSIKKCTRWLWFWIALSFISTEFSVILVRSYFEKSTCEWCDQEEYQGGRAPSIEMPSMTKIWQKSLVSSFSVSFSIFAYYNTRVLQWLTINNIDDQGARRTPFIQFFPSNLDVQLGWKQGFGPKSCFLRPSSKLFMTVMQ